MVAGGKSAQQQNVRISVWANLDLILLFTSCRWEAGSAMIKVLVEIRSGPHHGPDAGASIAIRQGQLPGHTTCTAA